MIAGQVAQLEAITENLANASTPGYRKLHVDHKRFESMLHDAVGRPMTWQEGRRYDPVSVDFNPGAIRATERPLDFAIHGDAFFVVEQDGNERFTRNGHFLMDAEGNLHDVNGFPVLGANGPLSIPPMTDPRVITVGDDGTLRAGTQVLGMLRLATFPDLGRLNRTGSTLFAAPPDMPPEEPMGGDVRLINGALEGSNTSVVEEMAEMITCMRSYEACQRMLRIQDENDGKMIQQLGGP